MTETNSDSGAAGNYSIAGGRSDSVTYLLDGSMNNNLLNNGVVYNSNPDTVAEFRVLESNYSAEYGRNGGGIISVVTKSGTNEFHSSAFEFLRNDAFNANSFFNKVDGLSRDVLKRNQYGGTLGGPIQKDKFFFFVGYQGQRLSAQTTTNSYRVFTPQELNGDFSQSGIAGDAMPNGDSNPTSHDPQVVCFLTGFFPGGSGCGTDANGDFTGNPGPANSFLQSNAAFAAQGIIDPAKINPIARNYIAAGLLPTDPSGFANYQGAETRNNNELTMKYDFLITQKEN